MIKGPFPLKDEHMTWAVFYWEEGRYAGFIIEPTSKHRLYIADEQLAIEVSRRLTSWQDMSDLIEGEKSRRAIHD